MSTSNVSLDKVRRLGPRIKARAAQHDAAGVFPVADIEDLAAAGLMGLFAPTSLGGSGATFADYVEVAYELARNNGATALVFNMHTSILGALARTPDDLARTMGAPASYFAARDETCRQAVAGRFFAVAMSERGAGSRLSELSTVYSRENNGYRIKGSKAFVSGAGHADAYLIAARSEDDDVSYFLVPAGDGLTVEETWDAMGMRATGSQDLHIDIWVPESTLLGGVDGIALPLAQIMPQWLVASYAAVYVGVAQSAIDAAVEHIETRNLAHLPAVRNRIGRADAAVAGALEVMRRAAHLIDTCPGEHVTNQWIYRAKLLAGQTAGDVATSMLEAAGTSATRKGNALERIFRDARCGSLQPATTDVCADWLGVDALGGDPNAKTESARW